MTHAMHRVTLIILVIMGYQFGSRIGYGSGTYGGYGQYAARRTLPANLAKRIGLPNVKLQFLLTVTVGQWLRQSTEAVVVTAKYPIPAAAVVTGVFIDSGSKSLVEKATLADFTAASGGVFFFDRTIQASDGKRRLHVKPPTGKTVLQDTYRAELTFSFARLATNIRDKYWEPRVLSVPNLSLRIEPRFGGVGQIGGGKISLANADGFFDELDTDEYQWDAGRAVLEFGIDLTDSALSEADYQRIGTWRIEDVKRTDTEFTLNVKELKTKLENKIPHTLYTRESYPALPNDWVGKPIPFAWGKHFSIKPAPIDPSLRKFKVAAHRIRSFDEVRVKQSNDSWKAVNFASVDTRLAEFTLSAGDWNGDQEVAVDFSGRTLSNGHLMENAADVMADLLDYVGETDLDWDSFVTSGYALHVGYNKYDEEVTVFAPSIYLSEQKTALEVASEINRIASSFLFVDFSGKWRYGVFSPVQAKDLDPMAGGLIRKFTEKDIIEGSWSKTVDSKDVFSKVNVHFGKRHQEEWDEAVFREQRRTQTLHNLPSLFTKEIEIGLAKRDDAQYWGDRQLVTEALPLTKFGWKVPWIGFFLLPGDKVHVDHDRHNVNSVLELLSVNYDLVNGQVTFEAGNQRGWGDTFGFWVPDIVEGAEPGPPKLPPGAVLHLRSQDLRLVHDERVQSWNDASGQNNHATQSTVANQPRLKNDQINGFPAVRFLGEVNTLGLQPLAYWRMNDSVAPIQDQTTGNRDLTVPSSGISFNQVGKLGDCIYRNGLAIAGLTRADDVPLRLGGTDFTLRCWINPVALNPTSGDIRLIYKSTDAATNGYAVEIVYSAGSKVRFITWSGAGATTALAATNLEVGRWYHIVCTYETGTMRIYINGVLENTIGVGFPMVASSGTFRVCAGISGNTITTLIDEVGIWTSRFTDAMVLDDFNGYAGRTYPDLRPSYLSLPNFLTALTEGEIFAVVKADNDPGSATGENSHLWHLGSATAERYPDASGIIGEIFGTTVAKAVGNPAPALTSWRVYNVVSQPNFFRALLDNVELFATATNTVGWPSAPTIGAALPSWFNGYIAELAIFNRVLTAVERDDVIKLLSTKYALGLSFPNATTLNVTPPPAWDQLWTNDQADAARQNSGYWTAQGALGKETQAADVFDYRSFWPSRWW